MLDLIVKTSSNQSSIVLDCFCGSGTTLKAAQINNRNWIGIDQSDLAIQVTKEKINNIAVDLFAKKKGFNFLKLTNTENKLQENKYLHIETL
jgi:adenine-specific DNA-methyltransferase